MATNARDVEFDLLARDKTSGAVRSATANFKGLKKATDGSTTSSDRWSKAAANVAKRVAAMAKAVLKGASTVASLASLAGPAIAGLIGLGKAAVAVGKGVAGMAPLAAFIPSLVGAVGLIAGTLKLAGPGLARAFQPVTRAFYDADGNASKLTKRIQDLASKGVEPLAKQFVKVNLPSISRAMEQISTATNGVVVRTMEWINSAEGIALIDKISTATGKTFDKLAPKIDGAVVAMLRLSGRAGDKAITGLGDVIGKILDKFTKWADSKSIDDINRSLDRLKAGWDGVKDTFDHVKSVVDFVVKNEAKIKAFTTALGVFALIGGIVSGAWPAALIAGMGLLLGNWDTVTRVFDGAKAWWSATWEGLKNDPVLQDFVKAVKTTVDEFKPILEKWAADFETKIKPKLDDLWATIHDKLIPALTDFINAARPWAKWFLEFLLPVVTTAFGGIIDTVKAAVEVIAGLLKFWTGVMSGDWSKAWQGIKDIISGVWGGILTTLQTAVAQLQHAFNAGSEALVSTARGFKDKILGAFSGAGSWLSSVGAAIVQGLASGITGAWSKVSGAVGGLIDKAKSAIPGPLRGLVGFGGGTDGWAPAQFAAQFAGGANFALAGGGGGGGRTGGPTPVDVTSNLYLDGSLVYSKTSKMLSAAEKRSRDRNKVGRR